MAKRKPAQPKRKKGLVGIRPKWSGGTWKWYARRRVEGVENVGPLRETQGEASDDYHAMRTVQRSLPDKILTLMDGLAVVIQEARDRGVKESTIQRQHKSHGKYLCLQFGEDTKLTAITPKAVEAFVTRARKGLDRNGKPILGRGGKPAGERSGRTIREKDLQLLTAIFKAARMESPVSAIKNRPAKPNRTRIDPFRMEEVVALVRRMRDEEFHDRNGNALHLPAREFHADLVQFMVSTGIRTGELCRLTVRDVDYRQRTITIAAKVRDLDRTASISDVLEPVVKRLVAYAKANNEGRFVPTGVTYLANLFKAWQRRLGQPRLNGRRLRQTAITHVIVKGMTLLDAKEFAGHTQVTTTSLYVEAVNNRSAAVAAALHSDFDEPVTPDEGESAA